jgi:hypothetical protein
MTKDSTINLFQTKQPKSVWIFSVLLFLVFSTIGLDLYYAKRNGGSFFISESILFSSFWLLFVPFLYYHNKFVGKSKKLLYSVLISFIFILLHILSYPALVWLLSELFYYHTYSYGQTLSYVLSEYTLIILIIYSFSFVISKWTKTQQNRQFVEKENQTTQKEYLSSLIVTESDNRKTVIDVKDIYYFSATSPYVTIHHKSKNFLSAQTLKSLESSLDGNVFVRIHKSCIVNVNMVNSIKSRLNGDYDLTLVNGTVLRISRNYAANFKNAFETTHHLTLK